MPDRIKNLLIGIFVATAAGIIIFMLLFLHPFIGDEGQTLHVLFTDIEKVNVGTRVLFAGKPVGEVVAIREVPAAIDKRASYDGDVYAYELVLSVDSSVKVYNSDRILLRTAGLLGEKSVAIDPEPLKPGQTLRLIGNEEIIYSQQIGSVEDTFQDIKIFADKLNVLIDDAIDALETLKRGKTWENVADSMQNINEISTRLAASWDNVDDTIKNLALTSENASTISGRVVKGEGSLGKIITNDDLYLKISSLLAKGETTFDDVNHYGILFHNDKNWQRLRARRMNLMEQLSTPQEFRNYFNDEVDQIQTSLTRVAMIMEQTSNCNDLECMMDNREFIKVYAELMRRVTSLEEEVRMYNIQLNQCGVYQTELIPNMCME